MLKFSAKIKERFKWGGLPSCSLAAGLLETEPLRDQDPGYNMYACMQKVSIFINALL